MLPKFYLHWGFNLVDYMICMLTMVSFDRFFDIICFVYLLSGCLIHLVDYIFCMSTTVSFDCFFAVYLFCLSFTWYIWQITCFACSLISFECFSAVYLYCLSCICTVYQFCCVDCLLELPAVVFSWHHETVMVRHILCLTVMVTHILCPKVMVRHIR